MGKRSQIKSRGSKCQMGSLNQLIKNLKKLAVSVIDDSDQEAQKLLDLWKEHKLINDSQKNSLTGPNGQKVVYTLKFESRNDLNQFLSKASNSTYNPKDYTNKLDYFGGYQFEGNPGIYSREQNDGSSIYLISGLTKEDLSTLNNQLRKG